MKKPEERIFLTDDTTNDDVMSSMVGVFKNTCVNQIPESWREIFENYCAVPGSCIGEKMFFTADKKGVTYGRALFEEGLLDKSNFQGWMLKPSKEDDMLPYDIISEGIVSDDVPDDIPDDVLLSFSSCPAPHVRRWSRLMCDRSVGAMLAGKGLLPKETLLRLLRKHAATDLAPFLASAGVDMKDVDFPDEVLDRGDKDGTTVAMALAGVGMLPEEKFEDRLESKNLNEDNLLHFAARSGRFPERFATDESASRRNKKWATPRDELLLRGLRDGTLSEGERAELRETLLRPLGNRETHTLGFRLLQVDLRTAKLIPPDVLVRILTGNGPDEKGESPLDDFLEREHSEGFGGILSEELLNAPCEAPDVFGETGRTFGEVFFLHAYAQSRYNGVYINPVRLLDGEGNIPSGLTERTLAAGADRGLPLAAAVSEILQLPPLSRELLSSKLGESASRFFKLESPCTLAQFLASRGVYQPAMAEMLESAGPSVEDPVVGDGRTAKELLATVLSEANREEKASERDVLVEALRIVSLLEHGEYEGYERKKWNLRSFFLKPLKGMSPEDFHDPLVLAVDAESERDANRFLRAEVRKVAERKRREWESGAGFEETEESVVL